MLIKHFEINRSRINFKMGRFFSIGPKLFVSGKNVISSLDFLRFQLILIKHRLRPLQVKWIQFEAVSIGWQKQLSFKYSIVFFFVPNRSILPMSYIIAREIFIKYYAFAKLWLFADASVSSSKNRKRDEKRNCISW